MALRHEKKEIDVMRDLLIEKGYEERVLVSTRNNNTYFLVLNTATDAMNSKKTSIVYVCLNNNFKIYTMPMDIFEGKTEVPGFKYPLFDYAIDRDEAIDAVLNWYDYNREIWNKKKEDGK